MSIFGEIVKSLLPEVGLKGLVPGLRRPTVLSILGRAAPWASSPTAALRELRGLGLGYTESAFREDWARQAPKFTGVESPTAFEQRYAYYYTAYLKDPEGVTYRESLAHYSDEPLTRQELRDVLDESWEEEARPYVSGAAAERASPYMFRIRGASIKTGEGTLRPVETPGW